MAIMTLRDFIMDEDGATAAEYALILAIVGAGIAGAVFTLGGIIANSLNTASNCIAAATSSGC
jgi:pilus assembly protein Flp/PilA